LILFIYRIVYTLCRQGHKKLLYDNVIEIYRSFCSETVKELDSIKQNETWLTILSQIVANYVKTFDIIINIFAYMVRQRLLFNIYYLYDILISIIFNIG